MISLQEIVRQYPAEMQRETFYDQMVKEYLHHHMLQLLFSHNTGSKICFLDGTALRYFYGIKRFSEDLDFDCTDLNRNEFMELTDDVTKGLHNMGFDVITEDKQRHLELKAFRRVYVFPELKYRMGLSPQKATKFFIKIEAESHHYKYEPQVKFLNGFGMAFPVRLVPPATMLSSKIAAAVNRKKDRDFYDVVHLLSFTYPDFRYLSEKLNIKTEKQLKDALLSAAREKKLDTRTVYDCDHMLFDKQERIKIKGFSDFIRSFGFGKFKK
jgi:predicted nucleotidyltransferase component of viral defense system